LIWLSFNILSSHQTQNFHGEKKFLATVTRNSLRYLLSGNNWR